MRKFGIVLKYELKEYFSNKGFMAFTLVLAILGAAALFLPRFIDMSDFTGVQIVGNADEGKEIADEDKENYAYIDLTENGIVQPEVLQQLCPDVIWHEVGSVEELEMSVRAGYDAGFVVTSPAEYE